MKVDCRREERDERKNYKERGVRNSQIFFFFLRRIEKISQFCNITFFHPSTFLSIINTSFFSFQAGVVDAINGITKSKLTVASGRVLKESDDGADVKKLNAATMVN